jgi:hypothetical protein
VEKKKERRREEKREEGRKDRKGKAENEVLNYWVYGIQLGQIEVSLSLLFLNLKKLNSNLSGKKWGIITWPD